METKEAGKRTWAEPKLTVFGDVEKLTLGNNKSYGTGDSFLFQGATTKLSG